MSDTIKLSRIEDAAPNDVSVDDLRTMADTIRAAHKFAHSVAIAVKLASLGYGSERGLGEVMRANQDLVELFSRFDWSDA